MLVIQNVLRAFLKMQKILAKSRCNAITEAPFQTEFRRDHVSFWQDFSLQKIQVFNALYCEKVS